MSYGSVSFEKRISENIRNYGIKQLFPYELLQKYMKESAELLNLQLLLTERHGEKVVSYGNWADKHPDVVSDPGRKIRIMNRTIGHLYVEENSEKDPSLKENKKLSECIEDFSALLEKMGEECYYRKEMAIYLSEMEENNKQSLIAAGVLEKKDPLTGFCNKSHFENRKKTIERSQVLPVAYISGNINDWQFVHDQFGEEEGNRLIRIVAELIEHASRKEYVIGRLEEDHFNILIPMAEKGEAESFCERVTSACEKYEDEILSPSIAFGIVYKENVEITFEELSSDVEYEMLQNKMEMKNDPEYKKRLEKALMKK